MISGFGNSFGAGMTPGFSGGVGGTGIQPNISGGMKDVGGDAQDDNTQSAGEMFGSMFKQASSAQFKADEARQALAIGGPNAPDPGEVALASAKAGVEIQMATRVISSASSGVRTLMQMQI